MDADVKEAGFILIFALFVGFGYFNVALDDLAFTQPAPHYRYLTAESFDVPYPEAHQIIQFGPSGEPLSWVTYYTLDEQVAPTLEFPDFIQAANAETTHRRTIIAADRIMTAGGAGGTHSPNPVTPCQDAAGAFGGLGGYPANKRLVTQSDTTCTGFYHQNTIGQPMFPPELAKHIDDFGWQARLISGQGGNGCNTDSIVGIPTTAAGQGGTMTFVQAVNSTIAGGNLGPQGPPKWSSSTAGCTIFLPPDFPTAIGAGMDFTGDQFYRDLFETGIYPNGDPLLDATGAGRLGMLHSVPGFPWGTRGVFSTVTINQNWFFADMSHVPTNATDGLWQIKEHSQYPTGIMDDCQYERLDDSFNIRTGTTDGERGQCLILKTFNTGETLFEDDFTTGFAHAAFDPNEWQTTFPSKFDINNVTGKIEISVDDTNDNAEGIRFNFPTIWEDDQVFVTRVSWDNAVLTNGTGTHDLFYTVSAGAITNRLSHVDGMSFSWKISPTGEKRFFTYFNDGALSQDIDDNGVFLNATDQGSAMDSGCMEMSREGRFFTWNFFTDTSCTILKDTLTRTVSTTAGQYTDFRYPSFHYSDQISIGTGSIDLEIRDVKIWNGVSEVPTSVFKPDIKIEGFVEGTGTNEMRINVGIFDGKQDAPFLYTLPQGSKSTPSDFDFDENNRRVDSGNGLQNFANHRMGETEINVGSPTPVPFSIEVSPHYPSGADEFTPTNGHFTVSIGLEDDSTDGLISANITKITVGEHEYDFDKPIVYFWEQAIPGTANQNCGGCLGTDTQAVQPELDYGWVDSNYTTIAPFVTAIDLPKPLSAITNVQASPVSSINVTWTHDQVNTTGYRIYRTSTESVDTINFLNTGLSGTGGLALSQSPRDHISQNNFIGNGLTGKIITDVSLRCRNFNDLATGGFLQGAIFVASQTGQTTDATLANSSNTILPTTISSTEQTIGPFKFRGDGLINHTTTGLRGIGLTWANPTGGSVLCAMADTLTGGSEQSRWDDPAWGRTNGFDLRIAINQLNQTKLSSPAVPFINDTGTLDNFFLDSTTQPNESYFYQIFPLNGNQEGPSVSVVNATQPAVPGKVQNLQLSHDNVNTEHDLTWDETDFAANYTVQRLSTERQIVESDGFGGESNFWDGLSNTNDIKGDDSGFDAFDIPTQTELRTARVFNGPNSPEGGQLTYGYWTNVISGGTNQIEPDYRSETTQYPGHLAGGTRLAKDCSRLSFNVEQDGMTLRSDGTWFDGNCQVENRYLGTELRNLTSAETANAEVNGLWRDQSEGNANGIIQILRPFAGGGSGWVFQDGAPNKWFSSIGIEQKSWVLNQTWVNITQVTTNSFSDPSNNYNTYFYRVIAENTISQEGPPSDIVNGTLSLPPLRIPDLNATDNGGSVDLEWEAAPIKFSRALSEDPVQGYLVQRSSGGNETVVYDGIGDAGGLNHDVETFFLDGTGLTDDTLNQNSANRGHAGQQLNITQAVNITRIVVKMGGGGPFNVEPDFGGSIHFANGTQITRSIMPRYSALDISQGDGFAHFVFSPPVELQPDEYIFGWQQAGASTCVGGACATTGGRYLDVFYETTGVGGGSSGYAIGEDRLGGGAFTDNPLNGTKDKDYAMAIFAEADWTTIGNTTNLNFTDNSPPIGVTKAYRILAFNDAGISHQPTLLHNPENTTIMQLGRFGGVGDDPFKPDAQGRLRAGSLNLGEMITFAIPPGDVPNAPTGLSAIADLLNVLLNWDDQGDADSFNVIRNGSTIATNVTLSEFTDVAPSQGSTFSYTVSAQNVNGSSLQSNATIILTNDVPSNVTGAGSMPVNGVAILVEWDDPVADDGEGLPTTGLTVSYDIFRSDFGLGEPFILLINLPEGTDFFNDTTAIGGHTYTYKILAKNGIGTAATNSTTTNPTQVANALVIRALEADGDDDLDGDVEITIFNNTFSTTLTGDGQGRVHFSPASGNYNFTIFYIGSGIDFVINKTITGVFGVIPTEDTVIDVFADVHKVNCPSNGPAADFQVFVNSSSADHFISDFSDPVCDANDKVSWTVNFQNLNQTVGGGAGVNSSALVVHHTFDSNTLFDSAFDETLYVNSGTYGHNADVNVLNENRHQDDVNGSPVGAGKIGDGSLFVNSTAEMNVGFSTLESLEQWQFLHSDNTSFSDTYSINLWLNGNWSSISADFVPILSDRNRFAGSNFMMLGILDTGEPMFSVDTDFGVTIDEAVGLGSLTDDTWHMVSVIIEKSNATSTGQLCVDTVCQSFDRDAVFSTQGDIANKMIIGNNRAVDFLGQTSTEEAANFFMDELCMWDGHKLSASDLATLHNSGTGSACGTVSQTGTSDQNVSIISNLFEETFNALMTDSGLTNSDIGNVTGFVGNVLSNSQDIYPNTFKVTKIIPTFSSFSTTNGTMTAVILSNVTIGDPKGFEVVVATSDTLDLTTTPTSHDPIAPSFGELPTFNFTSPPTLTATDDLFFGFRIDGLIISGGSFALEGFNSTTNGQGQCLFTNVTSSTWDQCQGVTLPIIPSISLEVQIVAENVADLQTSDTGGGGGGGPASLFATQMKTRVLSLGDFGNNAKGFIVNGTSVFTSFASPVITSNAINVNDPSPDILLTFDELFLQEQPPPPPVSQTPTASPPEGGGAGGLPIQPLTFFEDLFGFSLFSKLHQMQIGQFQDGTIDITWNSPEPITIEAIQVGDQFITWIGFPKTPFVLDGSDRISTGKIPYRVMPPSELCDEITGQTANCVNRILYDIPVKIFASVEGQPLSANTVVKINLSFDITLALFTIFIAFAGGVAAIIYRAVTAPETNQKQKKKKIQERKKKSRRQLESQIGRKKSKLRRLPS